jgi:hypothetical protein
VDRREAAVDAARQQGRVLVVGLHHQAVPLEAAKVLRERERDPGTPSAERRVSHPVPADLFDNGDARVFDAPELFRILLRIGDRRRLRVDDPAVGTVVGPRGAQMGVAMPVLHATEEQRRAVRQSRRPGVERERHERRTHRRAATLAGLIALGLFAWLTIALALG